MIDEICQALAGGIMVGAIVYLLLT